MSESLKTIRVRLVDHETRDRNGTQGAIYKNIVPSDFGNDLGAIQNERLRLRDEQNKKNYEYDKLRQNFIGTMTMTPKEVKFPDVKYDNNIKLHLDKDTGNTCLLVASSKAGKTTMMMKIYEKYYEDGINILFAQNPQIPEYKQKNLIRTDEYLPKIITIFKSVARENKNKFDFCCMFDDMLSLKADQNITDLFLSLRNSNISSIISLQYLNLMSKACRGNVNNVVAGSHNSDENILVLIKCYLISFMKKMGITDEANMLLYYRKLTEDHGFLIIHPATNEVTFCRLSI